MAGLDPAILYRHNWRTIVALIMGWSGVPLVSRPQENGRVEPGHDDLWGIRMNDRPPDRARSKARQERLARALRENLKRRKEQARLRRGGKERRRCL